MNKKTVFFIVGGVLLGIATVRAILGRRLGIDCGQAIRPNNRLTRQQRDEILEAAEEMGLVTHGPSSSS